MAADPKPANSVELTPPGGGTRILGSKLQDFILTACNRFFNTKYSILLQPGAGQAGIAIPGKITDGGNYRFVSFDLSTFPGVSAGGGTTGWHFPKISSTQTVIYDPTNAYEAFAVVEVLPDSAAVTTGYLDPDTGTVKYATPGAWVSLKAVPIGDVSGSPAYHLPRFPYPTAGNPDAANVYWFLIRKPIYCI
jgi:hypothetical protein